MASKPPHRRTVLLDDPDDPDAQPVDREKLLRHYDEWLATLPEGAIGAGLGPFRDDELVEAILALPVGGSACRRQNRQEKPE